jgi:type I restriction enzyme, R subunit
MSVLLDELIKLRKEQTDKYQEYLEKIIELTKKVKKPETNTTYPSSINSPAKRALYDNLNQNEELALSMDTRIMETKKDGWRDNKFKLRQVKYAIAEELEKHKLEEPSIEYILDIVKRHQEY